MDDYGLPQGYSRSNYRGEFNYEMLLTGHARDIMKYSDNDWKLFCSSVENFIKWCPEEIRNKGFKKLNELGLHRRQYTHVTPEMIVLYDDLLIYVNELLEQRNIIFKTGTFEIGHD